MEVSTESRSILFITLSCVGDAVMTTPALISLHQHFPDAVIDIVGDERSSLLFSHCPFAGEIINKDKTRPGRGVFELVGRLRQKSYDVIVDLRTDALPYLLRAKKRFTKFGSKPYGLHAVERMMGVIREIHKDNPIPPAFLWTGRSDDEGADDLLKPLSGDRWLALGPGAGGRAVKTWSTERYAALANSLSDVFTGVILVGTDEDGQITEAIGQRLNIQFVDLAGKTSLLQVASVLKKAGFFIGSDSGLGHIAGAVSTPTLSFFSVDRPERVLPWSNRAFWLLGQDNDARNITLEDAELKIRSCL